MRQLSGWQRGQEWRRGASPIAQAFCWGVASLHSVIFSVICVPCHCAKGSRRELPLSQGGNAVTEFFNTTIHRVRVGHWRKFRSALEKQALPEVCGESSAVTFPDFLEHHKVICHFTTQWPLPNLFSDCYLSIFISPSSTASLLIWNYFCCLSSSGGGMFFFPFTPLSLWAHLLSRCDVPARWKACWLFAGKAQSGTAGDSRDCGREGLWNLLFPSASW